MIYFCDNPLCKFRVMRESSIGEPMSFTKEDEKGMKVQKITLDSYPYYKKFHTGEENLQLVLCEVCNKAVELFLSKGEGVRHLPSEGDIKREGDLQIESERITKIKRRGNPEKKRQKILKRPFKKTKARQPKLLP